MSSPTRIVVVGPHRWRTFSVFNGNAFSPELRLSVDACSARLALVFYHAANMLAALDRDAAEFRRILEGQRRDLESAVRKRPELSPVAVYAGLGATSELHNVLNATKSFLDLYAKLIGKLLHQGNEWAFRKANVDGTKVAGGRFINCLRNSSKAGEFAPLADLTLEHSTSWITRAVSYRDQLSHRSDLDDMVPMHLPLSAEAPCLRFEDVVAPVMPNGLEVGRYVGKVENELARFVSESITMVPNVDLSLLSPNRLQRSSSTD